MFSKPIMHNRIGKWSLTLTEFSLIFEPLKSIEGKVVANFMVDHTFMGIEELYIGIKPWMLYFDGSRIDGGLGVGSL